MGLTRKLARIVGWIALLVWPALLPHPADDIAGCIWYPVLALFGLIYFLGRLQDSTAAGQAPVPARDLSTAVSPASSSRQLAGVTSTSGQPWPEGTD